MQVVIRVPKGPAMHARVREQGYAVFISSYTAHSVASQGKCLLKKPMLGISTWKDVIAEPLKIMGEMT